MFARMEKVGHIERRLINELAGLYTAGEARQICFMLFEARLGWSKADYLLHRQDTVDNDVYAWIVESLPALKSAKPIQQILGYAWFSGMKLIVDESVLIPRPETEELVALIAAQYADWTNRPLRIIDVGTGSGCIAIALKKALPRSAVYALDISQDALRIAKQNAANQATTVAFIHADILEWDLFFQPDQTFDIVVSNPPYITYSEQADMSRNVLAHEPHTALFVEDSTPLVFYEHIAAFAHQHLNPGGRLYFEINRKYGTQLCKVLENKGFDDVLLHTDMHGADRMIQAKI